MVSGGEAADSAPRSTLLTLRRPGRPMSDLHSHGFLGESGTLDVYGVLCDPTATAWQADLNEVADRIDDLLLTTGHDERDVPTGDLDAALRRRTSVRTAESPASFGELAVRVSDHLSQLSPPSVTTVVFVDSLDAAAAGVSQSSVDRFLHALTESVQHNDARCHVSFDGASFSADDRTLLADCFDVVVE